MSGYAKDWVEKFSDPWYVSLRLNERGLFDQLKTYAKLHGDTGKIFLRNFSHAGTEFGCDRSCASRILRKLASDGKVNLIENENGLELFIRNYKYWQRVKKVGDGGKSAESQRKPVGKPRLNKSRADKIRAEQSRVVSDKSSDFDTAWDGLVKDRKLGSYLTKGIDLNLEQTKMTNWVSENPGKKNYRRFIINWLNRSLGDGQQKTGGKPKISKPEDFPESGPTTL